MEALVSQDFEFNLLSKAYAEFILECSDGYPEGRIERVPPGLYLNKDQNTIQVNFQSPEGVAVFLKLKFGAHLRERPAMPPFEANKEMYEQIRKLAGLYDIKKTNLNNNYKKINILKTRNEIYDFSKRKDADFEE